MYMDKILPKTLRCCRPCLGALYAEFYLMRLQDSRPRD